MGLGGHLLLELPCPAGDARLASPLCRCWCASPAACGCAFFLAAIGNPDSF